MSNFKYSILLFVLFVSPLYLKAQDKFGYVNTQELLVLLPGYELAEDSLLAFEKRLEGSLLKMKEDYDRLRKEYEEGGTNTNSMHICSGFSTIRYLEKRMQKIAQSREQLLFDKQAELLKPLVTLIMNAIQAVAVEHGYSYIFDSSVFDIFTVVPEAHDISLLVKKKLGLID